MPYPEGVSGADIDALSEPDRHDCGDCCGSGLEDAAESLWRARDVVRKHLSCRYPYGLTANNYDPDCRGRPAPGQICRCAEIAAAVLHAAAEGDKPCPRCEGTGVEPIDPDPAATEAEHRREWAEADELEGLDRDD